LTIVFRISQYLLTGWSRRSMTIAVEEDVRGVLGPEREEKIERALARAWEDWFEDPRRSMYSRWPRTRANMVFERIAARLQEEFADDPQVQFHFQDETIKVVFDDSVLVRFKKADEDGFGCNITTQATIAFCEAQADLPGLPGLQKVEILYHLNDLQTYVSGITVQARDGDMRLWAYSLDASGAAQAPLPFPAPPPRPPYDASDLVRPRPPSSADEDKSEE
jgi:hypothetical protein